MNIDDALDAAVKSPNHTFLGALAEPPEEGASPEDYDVIDVHFFIVWVHKGAAPEVQSVIRDYVMKHCPAETLAGGPSYITLGADVGDQSRALRIMAFGASAGWWDLITPKTLRIVGEQADRLAGSGFVMVTPPRWLKDTTREGS